MRPGEVSLAHGGVLFIDEMGQFAPSVLDTLREAVESGIIAVGRANHHISLPARFQLVGATNPCPCGEGGAPGSCECDERSRQRYLGRLSGPLLDRFDLRIAVSRPAVGELMGEGVAESTAAVAERVNRARELAQERSGRLNSALDGDGLDRWAIPDQEASQLLRHEMETGRLTGRGYHRVRRTARTVADLAGCTDGHLGEEHVAVALSMRTVVSRHRRVGAA